MIKVYLSLFLTFTLLAGCSAQDPPTIGLSLAVERGDIDQIKRHIHRGTNINQTIKNGQRPLHVAVNQGDSIVVKLLTENGADSDALNQNGESPLTRAVIMGRTQIAEYLVEQGAKLDANALLRQIVMADVTGRDAVRLLVSWGAVINRQDSTGSTPLISAIQRNNRVLAKHFINNGADVNLPDSSGHLPLDIALQLSNAGIIRLLEKNGARTATEK